MFWSERLRRSSSAFTTAPKSRAALLAPGGVARAGAGLSMAGYEAPLGGAGVGYPHAAGGPSAGMSRASGSWSRQASYSACRVRNWSTVSAHRFGRGRRSFGRTMVRKPRFWSPQRQSVKRECRTGRARQMARVQAQRRRSDDAGTSLAAADEVPPRPTASRKAVPAVVLGVAVPHRPYRPLRTRGGNPNARGGAHMLQPVGQGLREPRRTVPTDTPDPLRPRARRLLTALRGGGYTAPVRHGRPEIPHRARRQRPQQ